jgi:hypothetical protein
MAMDWTILLSSAVVGTVVATGAAVINAYLTRRFEHKKWYAQFFLTPKLDALRALHAALIKSHYEINLRAVADRPITLRDFKEQAEAPKDKFFQALALAEIYMDEESSKEMHAVLGALRQMTMSIWLRLPQSELPAGIVIASYGDELINPDWKLFTDTFNVAEKRLGALLNPREFLRPLEKL